MAVPHQESDRVLASAGQEQTSVMATEGLFSLSPLCLHVCPLYPREKESIHSPCPLMIYWRPSILTLIVLKYQLSEFHPTVFVHFFFQFKHTNLSGNIRNLFEKPKYCKILSLAAVERLAKGERERKPYVNVFFTFIYYGGSFTESNALFFQERHEAGSCPIQSQCDLLATRQLHWSSWG